MTCSDISVILKTRIETQFLLRANRTNLLSNTYGFSGYDNSLKSMESVLLVQGPQFTNSRLPQTVAAEDEDAPIDAVHVFPLLCHLLGKHVKN